MATERLTVSIGVALSLGAILLVRFLMSLPETECWNTFYLLYDKGVR